MGESHVHPRTPASALDVLSGSQGNASIQPCSKRVILVSGLDETMRELARFLARVMECKRRLKLVYYSTRDESTKADTKELVAATISTQKAAEDLLTKCSNTKVARKALEDRKAELVLQMWSTGLPERVHDYTSRQRKLPQGHLHKYQQTLLEYIGGIAQELVGWSKDIETLIELPRVPREQEGKR
jgi:hypothetical protein